MSRTLAARVRVWRRLGRWCLPTCPCFLTKGVRSLRALFWQLARAHVGLYMANARRVVPRLSPHDVCRTHRAARTDPLVAHCIIGQMRGFVERRIIGSIKVNLVDALSHRHRVFVVASLDCRMEDGSRAACAEYSFGDLERALAFLGAERLDLGPSKAPPAPECSSGTPVLKDPTQHSFFHQVWAIPPDIPTNTHTRIHICICTCTLCAPAPASASACNPYRLHHSGRRLDAATSTLCSTSTRRASALTGWYVRGPITSGRPLRHRLSRSLVMR